jgi:hypothetical protein
MGATKRLIVRGQTRPVPRVGSLADEIERTLDAKLTFARLEENDRVGADHFSKFDRDEDGR